MEFTWDLFWGQIFSPLNNFLIIFFSILIATLVSKLVREMEESDFLEVKWFDNNFMDGLLSFIFRFLLAFLITMVVVFILIILISVLIALIGFIKINFLS